MKDFEKFVRHLKFESLALAILMVVLTYRSPYSLWWLIISFLAFDIGMIGYLFNEKVGAFTYNQMHNYTVPTLLIALGIVINTPWISLIGYCWIFHISVDRVMGFGLKDKKSFKHTHLGNLR